MLEKLSSNNTKLKPSLTTRLEYNPKLQMLTEHKLKLLREKTHPSIPLNPKKNVPAG
jgi:hypothetical protein